MGSIQSILITATSSLVGVSYEHPLPTVAILGGSEGPGSGVTLGVALGKGLKWSISDLD